MEKAVRATQFASSEVAAKTKYIYHTILNESNYLDAGNFRSIHPNDIARLFDLYDAEFFAGQCRKQLGDRQITFRLSKRMTKSGGHTARFARRGPDGTTLRDERFEIAVASSLLFQTFQEEHRPVLMSGIRCHDRLEALQRVMEHEIVHLVELLIWRDSSCAARRYQSIAQRFFAHTEHRHQLITPAENAHRKYGIHAGCKVSFEHEGREYVGRVNRVTKRATVLVEDKHGQPYSDGRRYAKFYVPIRLLRPLGVSN